MTFTDHVFEEFKDSDKIAVIDKNKISYREIYGGVNYVTYLLQENGCSKENSVLVISDNSVFFIKTYFGIIKNGSICVPVNPTISENDMRYIMDILKIKIVFCQKKYRNKVDKIVCRDTMVYSEESIWASKDETNPSGFIDEKEDTALIMFTSGSTSKPKGVMLTHYNLMYNTNSIIEYLKLTKNDRVEVVLPFYYCYGTSLLNTHFRCGGSLVINNRFMFPETVIEDIKKYNCTGFAGVPSTYQILLRMTSIKTAKLHSLRYVTQAGGRLPEVFISELCEALEGTDVYIMYGQTEATARLSYLPPEQIKNKLGSIGCGIPGTELVVLNKEGNPTSVGEVGEIAARGGNIMKGYFNDQEETKKVLKNDLLYTGDLAFRDEDGYIFVVSREKNIIKCAGNRISPKEIENTICSIKEVVECAVIGVEDDILGEAIKAFVVLKDKNSSIDDKYIIDYCFSVLPRYKLPKYVQFLSQLPKNSSGKVLFAKLKDM